MPLDGTVRSAAAVAATAEQLSREGVDLVVLHVFNAETVPMFWDQYAHAGQTWAQEFLARYLAQPNARMELRVGTAVEHLLQVAEAEQADMITLGWSQHLEPGRSLIVRRAILGAAVPVMLVPINRY
jgi:nucleotide-binding universal stress UspA family protein